MVCPSGNSCEFRSAGASDESLLFSACVPVARGEAESYCVAALAVEVVKLG
jgi:hypothetical protein